MFGFILKKLVSRILFPVPLGLEMLTLGIILQRLRNHKKTGFLCIIAGTLLLLILSLSGPSTMLLRPLENAYPPAFATTHSSKNLPRVDWIVVLGGGTIPAPHRPPNARLRTGSLERVMEGMRLARLFPNARVIFTGFSPYGEAHSSAATMAQTAMLLGMDKARITRIPQAMDTSDEARLCAEHITPNDRMILVTSSSHLYRAMLLFRKQGLYPIPAPAGYQCNTINSISYQDFIPSAGNLKCSARAIYEYMGLAWAYLRGLI